jgi:hypothetical protein
MRENIRLRHTHLFYRRLLMITLCIFEKEEDRKEQQKAIFVLEHTSLRYGGKARKEENTSINTE